MNKAANNNQNNPYNTKNKLPPPKNVPETIQTIPKFIKTGKDYDNTIDDYIIDSNSTNNELQKVNGPFNFIYNTTNNTNGNIYGNLSVTNVNVPHNQLTRETKEMEFFKEAFNSLLGQYTNMTQSLMESNFNKEEKKEINKDEQLKNEELNSTIACLLNIQKTQQIQIDQLINNMRLCSNNLNAINDYFNNLNFPVTYPQNIKTLNEIKEHNKLLKENFEKKRIIIESLNNLRYTKTNLQK